MLGGNGSLAAAGDLAERLDAPVVGIPATIDNDVAATDLSLGHATAVAYGVAAVDRVRDTTEALPRFFAIETVGGGTGHFALAVGRLAGADAILLRNSFLLRVARPRIAALRAVAEAAATPWRGRPFATSLPASRNGWHRDCASTSWIGREGRMLCPPRMA